MAGPCLRWTPFPAGALDIIVEKETLPRKSKRLASAHFHKALPLKTMNDSTPQKDESPATPEETTTSADSVDSAVAAVKDAVDPILQKRLIAGVIDVAVGLGLAFVISFIPKVGSIGFLLNLAYWLTKDALPFLDGLSVGKKVMGLRAVTTEGKPLTGNWKASAIRNVFLYIALVEAIVLVLRKDDPAKKGLRLGDDFAHTKVILSQD